MTFSGDISLSSVKKIENGTIGTFDGLMRVLRMLGKLDVLLPLVEEESLSPNEYYELKQKAAVHQRKRAAGKIRKTEEASEW